MYKSFFLTRLKRKIFPWLFLIKPFSFILTFIILVVFFIQFILPKFTHFFLAQKLIFSLVSQREGKLRNDKQRVNILLMGIGGGNHEGATLTDSLIVASLNLSKKTVSLITIPRDLWIEEIKEKINAAYQTGEENKRGIGIILAKATAAEVLGIPVQYGFLVDFHAFQQVVDLIGGVDINIEKNFDDYEYPIEGKENDLCGKTEEDIKDITDDNLAEIFPCRFEHVRFENGVNHFTGLMALKYVRSRHAEGDEGTDFSRSKRQLKLLEAIKNKLVKPETFFNPKFLLQLSGDLSNDIDTDLTADQMIYLGKTFSQVSFSSVKTLTIDWGSENDEGLLINPPVSDYGAWVLIPRSGDWNEIHQKVKSFLELK